MRAVRCTKLVKNAQLSSEIRRMWELQKKRTLPKDMQINEGNTTHRKKVIISSRRQLGLKQNSEDKREKQEGLL